MRKLYLIFIFLIILPTVSFSQVKVVLEKPKVDKRIELLSIVFRLAGAFEYNMNNFKSYTDVIENHYAPYKHHRLITFTKKIRDENKIAFDAVMEMAIYLDDNLNLLKPYHRWGDENVATFVYLLKAFYKDTKSRQFFKKSKNIYAEASKRFLPIYDKIDTSWFMSFYGKPPKDDFLIVNALGNGGANYGISIELPKQNRKVYAVMGAWTTDDKGMVTFEMTDYFPILIHEFAHSFVNELLDKNPSPFQESGNQIFEFVKDKMREKAYNDWHTMLNEALVRASVIKYMKDHLFSQQEIEKEIKEQKALGFYWIEDLVSELEKYDTERAYYPTLESYMPCLAEAYKVFAQKLPTNSQLSTQN